MTDHVKDEFIEHGNHQRADHALHAIEQAGYLAGDPAAIACALGVEVPEQWQHGTSLQLAITDLVNDLMHLAAREHLDWIAILGRATTSYQEEQTEP